MTRQPSMFGRPALTPALVASFSAFWSAYPKRSPNPRAMAEAAFLVAVRGGAEPAQLVAAARAYAEEVKTKGIQESFIVHAATFLRQRRFLDYAEVPEAAPAASAAPVHALWSELLDHIDAPVFGAWIGRCTVVSRTTAVLTLAAPSTFVAARMRQDFVPLLERILACRVVITITTEPAR